MSEDGIFLFHQDNTCRVCLWRADGSTENGQSLFNAYHKEPKKIDKMMRSLTNMQTLHNDRLPLKLCNFCVSKAKMAYNFQLQVNAAHKAVLHYLCSEKYSDMGEIKKTEDNSNVENDVISKILKGDKAKKRRNIKRQKQYTCKYCHRGFTSKCNFNTHMAAHAQTEKLSCPSCSAVFVDRSQLTRHQNLTHTGQSHKCGECQKVFPHSSRLRSHMLCHTREDMKRHACPQCGKRFNHQHHLSNHVRVHTQHKPYLCSQCGKGFTQSHQLTLHLRSHSEVRPFPCDVCTKSFAQESRLKRHLATHTGEKPFMCSFCGKCFVSKTCLRRHSLLFHPETTSRVGDSKGGENNVQCKFCPETFTSARVLSAHIKQHTCKHVCDKCKRAFTLASTLQRHLKTHTETSRPHSCSECDVSYKTPQQLRYHRKRAHAARTHFCSLCCKAFCYNVDLKVHMRSHTDERPYICDVCQKGCRTSSCLTVHKRTHTGEKPYTCQKCAKAFSTSTGLICHMKTHKNNAGFHLEEHSNVEDDIQNSNSEDGIQCSNLEYVVENMNVEVIDNPNSECVIADSNLKDGVNSNLEDAVNIEFVENSSMEYVIANSNLNDDVEYSNLEGVVNMNVEVIDGSNMEYIITHSNLEDCAESSNLGSDIEYVNAEVIDNSNMEYVILNSNLEGIGVLQEGIHKKVIVKSLDNSLKNDVPFIDFIESSSGFENLKFVTQNHQDVIVDEEENVAIEEYDKINNGDRICDVTKSLNGKIIRQMPETLQHLHKTQIHSNFKIKTSHGICNNSNTSQKYSNLESLVLPQNDVILNFNNVDRLKDGGRLYARDGSKSKLKSLLKSKNK